MNYNVLCMPRVDSFGIDYIVETNGFQVKVGDLAYDYGEDVVYKYIQTGSSDYEWKKVKDDPNYKELIKVSQEFISWEGKDHDATEMFIINIDYPKKENSSDSIDSPNEAPTFKPDFSFEDEEPEESEDNKITCVHAHINSIIPDHIVVGDDDKNEIYSLTETIGSESNPVYIKDGIITPTADFSRGATDIKITSDIESATITLSRLDSTEFSASIPSASNEHSGLMSVNLYNKLNGFDSKIQTLHADLSTKIDRVENEVTSQIYENIPSKEQVNRWATTAAETALTNGLAGKWSAIARNIELDRDGNIVAINGAGFVTDDTFSEMLAGYVDGEGKQKFASIITSVYKDELGNITSQITAQADKIQMKAYKEAALRVFSENQNKIASELALNQEFVRLVWNETGSEISGSITIQGVLDYAINAEGRKISEILLDADKISTGDSVKAINLLAKNYTDHNGSFNFTGFVSQKDWSGIINGVSEKVDKISGIFSTNDEGSTIYLDADRVLFRDGATIGTYINTLADYDNSTGSVTLNPTIVATTTNIDAILNGQTSLGANHAPYKQSVTDYVKGLIRAEVNTNPDTGDKETSLYISASNIYIAENSDLTQEEARDAAKVGDVFAIENGEITCKAATFTEGQRTIFSNTLKNYPVTIEYVGNPLYAYPSGDNSYYYMDMFNPYWYGNDYIELPSSMDSIIDRDELTSKEDIKSGDTVYLAKEIWDKYEKYYDGSKPSYNIYPDSMDTNGNVMKYSDYYEARMDAMYVISQDHVGELPPSGSSSLLERNDTMVEDTAYYITKTNLVITGTNIILPCNEDWVGRKVILTNMHSDSSTAFNTSILIPEYNKIYNAANDYDNMYLDAVSMIGLYDGMVELCYLPCSTRVKGSFDSNDYCWFITNSRCKNLYYYKGKVNIVKQ